MSILDKLLPGAARAKAKRAPQLARYASEHGSFDEWVLRDLKDASPTFRQAMEQPIRLQDGQAYEPSADIHDDLFLTAHAPGESRTRRPDEVRPSHRFGRDVLDAFVRTDEHRDSKPYTEADEIASAIYARAASEKFDELMASEAAREHAERSRDAAQQENAIAGAQAAIEAMRGQAQQALADGEPLPGDFAQRMKEQIAQREQAASDLAQIEANMPQNLPTDVRAAAQEAAKDAQDHVETWGAVAGSGASELGHVNPDEAWALTEAWMQVPDYQEFCKILGRVMRDFRSQDAKRVIGGDEEIVGVTQGNDLTMVLTSELAQLGNPNLRRKFLRDYMDESLLMFETQGHEKVSLGPGVFCIDLSGSMGGQKAMEAKAVAVGFVRLMHKKKRDAVVIGFNGRVMWERHFHHRAGLDMSGLLELAGLRPSGGTDITNAVAKAKTYIDKSPTFKRADVVVITDGQDSYGSADEKIRDHWRETGVRSHGIAIGHTPAPAGWLLTFCDDALSVAQLTEATGDLVRAMA